MREGLGEKEKKVWFNGKHLKINQINFEENGFSLEVLVFLRKFLDVSETFTVKTSGSTGIPKPLSLSKKYMIASAEKTIEAFNLKTKAKILLALSPNHIGGIMMLVRWLVGDLDLYVTEPSKIPLRNVNQRMDFTALVPYQLSHSLNDLHKVKTTIIGGGAVSNLLEKQAIKANCTLYHTYGMTETISHIALRKFGEEAYFKAVRAVQFDVDARNCLRITAPHLGIENLQTNDVVELRDTSHFKWKGRYDNVVNSGGIKLHPELIEKKLEGFPYPYFLAGLPDSTLGEKLVMLIEHEKFSNKECKELLPWIANRVGKYENPKTLIAVKSFLRTPTDKVKRDLKLYDLSDF